MVFVNGVDSSQLCIMQSLEADISNITRETKRVVRLPARIPAVNVQITK